MIGALPLFPIVVAGGLAYPFAIDKIQSWLWPAPIPPPAPAAPQTETEMRTWTPELAAERGLEAQPMMGFIRRADPPSAWPWLAILAAAAAAWWFTRSRNQCAAARRRRIKRRFLLS
jgi:hypothetical protein